MVRLICQDSIQTPLPAISVILDTNWLELTPGLVWAMDIGVALSPPVNKVCLTKVCLTKLFLQFIRNDLSNFFLYYFILHKNAFDEVSLLICSALL